MIQAHHGCGARKRQYSANHNEPGDGTIVAACSESAREGQFRLGTAAGIEYQAGDATDVNRGGEFQAQLGAANMPRNQSDDGQFLDGLGVVKVDCVDECHATEGVVVSTIRAECDNQTLDDDDDYRHLPVTGDPNELKIAGLKPIPLQIAAATATARRLSLSAEIPISSAYSHWVARLKMASQLSRTKRLILKRPMEVLETQTQRLTPQFPGLAFPINIVAFPMRKTNNGAGRRESDPQIPAGASEEDSNAGDGEPLNDPHYSHSDGQPRVNAHASGIPYGEDQADDAVITVDDLADVAAGNPFGEIQAEIAVTAPDNQFIAVKAPDSQDAAANAGGY